MPDTLRPWRIGRPGTIVSDQGPDEGALGPEAQTHYRGKRLVCEGINAADAVLVVRAVNAYEELKARLRDLIGALERAETLADADLLRATLRARLLVSNLEYADAQA